ncbi:MAG: AMP-binding protein [SAR324 cluster bacterium]|nr:AMP-binding protein [SAR324 cluster bacterium]
MNPVDELTARAAALTVGHLLREQARRQPDAVAIVDENREWRYAEFNGRVNRLAAVLAGMGIVRGDRVAILAENRVEYLELVYACAKQGAILAAQNWRLADGELRHCIGLTTPKAIVVSPRFAATLRRIDHGVETVIELGGDYEARLAGADPAEPEIAAEPEDGLLILYTSGTTGLPKGALISHRAELARLQVALLELGLKREEAFVAWAPMFHMVSTDQSITLLSIGGTVYIVDGFDPARLVDIVARVKLWWLILMPGTVEPFIDAMKERGVKPKGVNRCGAMADLVPLHQIAEVTRLLDAPYCNTFGATETGAIPASGNVIPVGVVPENLSKTQMTYCQCRLVDPEDRDVPDGTPGEMAVRGPTLFSGYWNADETNARDFRGGWFHMGDMFVRNPDGSLDFVDRVKYMIKSGGENIYPAEIERVLLSDSRVQDAVVVRRRDEKWGEVPIAFVARSDESLTGEELIARCKAELAGYKRPKEIRFVALDDLPRSTTGKIQRHEVEKWLED